MLPLGWRHPCDAMSRPGTEDMHRTRIRSSNLNPAPIRMHQSGNLARIRLDFVTLARVARTRRDGA